MQKDKKQGDCQVHLTNSGNMILYDNQLYREEQNEM